MKRSYKFLLFYWLIISVSLLLFPIAKTSAQTVGIKISPVRIDELADPGESKKLDIIVTNISDVDKTLYAYLSDFRAADESGKPTLVAPGSQEGYFLASWIDITAEGTNFTAGETKIIPFTINIPANAGPGGYYGAILFGTVPPRAHVEGEERGAGMSVAQQVGTLVLLQVKGETEEEARIREFTTDKSVYNTPFNVNFLLRIENVGNVHVKPIGRITIENMFGKEVDQVDVNFEGSNVLPRSIRRFQTEWPGENGFGRYKARLGLSYGTDVSMGGQGKQSLFTELTFWIIPWQIITPILVALVFVVAIFLLFIRLYKNKAVQKAMQQAGLGHVRYVKKFQGPSPTLHFSVILAVILTILFFILLAVYFLLFA
jgi:hypothetical protein